MTRAGREKHGIVVSHAFQGFYNAHPVVKSALMFEFHMHPTAAYLYNQE
jgi:hypothetical protein